MKAAVLAFALAFLFFLPPVLSEEASMLVVGTCREYNATVSLEGFEAGCYDVKVDVTTPAGRVGRIFDPREGWKSSFFYVRGDLCVEDAAQNVSKTYRLSAETSSGNLNFRGTVRYGEKTWEAGVQEKVQDCPEAFPGDEGPAFWLVVLSSMLVILIGLAIHKKFTMG